MRGRGVKGVCVRGKGVKGVCVGGARGSHIHVACRSVCNRDQNGIKRSTFFFGANQGIKTILSD